jgi:hypothetical protein
MPLASNSKFVADLRFLWWAVAVFAFARLLSAPITPGGLGIVELARIGGLYATGKSTADVPLDLFRGQMAAAGPVVPGTDLRSADPARQPHVPDLAAQEELANSPCARAARGRNRDVALTQGGRPESLLSACMLNAYSQIGALRGHWELQALSP